MDGTRGGNVRGESEPTPCCRRGRCLRGGSRPPRVLFLGGDGLGGGGGGLASPMSRGGFETGGGERERERGAEKIKKTRSVLPFHLSQKILKKTARAAPIAGRSSEIVSSGFEENIIRPRPSVWYPSPEETVRREAGFYTIRSLLSVVATCYLVTHASASPCMMDHNPQSGYNAIAYL